jgi:hypothetical protein
VVRVAPPEVDASVAREIWIATDLTDPFAARLARRVADALVDLAPTRLVRPGAPPAAGVVVVGLASSRSTTLEPEVVQQPVWTCDPSGACFSRHVPRVVDVPVVRLLVRYGVHDAAGRALVRPRALDLVESGDDELGSELRLLGRAARHVGALFRSTREELRLAVEGLGDDPARLALRSALEAPTAERCAALEALVPRATDREERGRRLFAAGQCHRAVGLVSDSMASLRAAEALLLRAVRERPRDLYARALEATRAALEALARSSERIITPVETAPDEAIPEPPPTYR